MTHHPESEKVPAGRDYEGRALPRPDDEIVDQGAGFDMQTLVTRRRVLALVGLGVGAAALAACSSGTSSGSSSSGSTSSTAATSSSAATSSTSPAGSSSAMSTVTATGEIPDETNGPYPADGTSDLNILQGSGIVRSDITTSLDGGTTVEGVPLSMTFTVTDIANGNVPFQGAALYAWQCDAQGRYSMYTSGVEDETYLRGIQIADADGILTFNTIVPGCYSGRWTHIHFEVYPDADSVTDVGNAIATSQLAFPPEMLAEVYALNSYPESATNLAGVGTAIADDNIFGDGDWELEVPTITGDAASGYRATLGVAIDTTTDPQSGGGPGGR